MQNPLPSAMECCLPPDCSAERLILIPVRFEHRYIRNTQPESLPVSFAFGSAFHAGLEHLYRSKLEGVQLTCDDLIEAYRDAWNKQENNVDAIPIAYNKSNPDADAMQQLAVRMFEVFVGRDILGDARVISVEDALRGRLAVDLPDILAVADLIVLDDDGLRIIDFKTSRSRWKPEQAIEQAEQLLLYRRIAHHLCQSTGKPMHLEFVVITKAKKPIVQRFDVPVNHQQLQRTVGTFRQVWQAMQVGSYYPVPSPMNCNICPYKGKCPAFSQ